MDTNVDQPPANDGAKVPTDDVLSFIRHLEDGDFESQLNDDLTKVVTELRQYATENGGNPKARIGITLDFAYDFKRQMVTVVGDIAIKTPKPPRGSSMFYTTKQGGLTRQDPRQVELELKSPDVVGQIGDVRAAEPTA